MPGLESMEDSEIPNLEDIPELEELENPEVLACEVWLHEPPYKTVSYIDIAGKSPEITNWLSVVKYEIIRGTGRFSTAGAFAELQAGDVLSVAPRHKRQYEGIFSAIVTHCPAIHPDFVTFSGEKLGTAEKRILHQIDRREAFYEAVDQIASTLDIRTLFYLENEKRKIR